LAEISEPERHLIRLFQARDGLTILDVGSCEGEDSIRYARRFPFARIFAFEPLPDNVHLIQENIAKYNACNVEIIPQALSDRIGEADFYVSSGAPPKPFAGEQWIYGNKSSSLLSPAVPGAMYGWIEFKRKIRVPTNTVAEFCRARDIGTIDFLHLDVQGGELLVLSGAGPMLRKIGAIWLEVSDVELYRGQPLRKEVRAVMRANGFARCSVVNNGVEGDEFYVNLRRPRMWRHLIRVHANRCIAFLRFYAGMIRSRIAFQPLSGKRS